MTAALIQTVEDVTLRVGDRPGNTELQDLQIAADRIQRSSQLVAHHGEKAAFGAVGFVSGDRHLLESFSLFAHLFALQLELHRLRFQQVVCTLKLFLLTFQHFIRAFRRAPRTE